jgi:serine/threonine protein kinase
VLNTSETSIGDDANGESQHHDGDDNNQGPKGYAIKIISKTEVLKLSLTSAVLTEKHVLTESLATETGDPAGGSELFMKLFMCFNDANSLYLVLELCGGGTLLDAIESRRADGASPVMDVPWVRYYASQILRAIEYMHQRGVIHRDITPQNIGLTFPKGEVKLGDFGSAAVLVKGNAEEGSKLKRWVPPGQGSDNSGDFVGTADYVTPEMLRGKYDFFGPSIDCANYPALDLWAFGCLVYHMFVGETPFHGETEYVSFRRVLDYANGQSKLMARSPSFSDEAKDLISTLLSKEPSRRLGMQDGVIESSIASSDVPANDESGTSSHKKYQSIRDHSFFQVDNGMTIWDQIECPTSVEPPYEPTEPKWMIDLRQGDATLKSFESIQFDL